MNCSLKSIPETTNASDNILSLLRGQGGYRKENSKRAPATLSKAISKVGLVNPSIRVNRVGGPMGHAGGMTMSDIRRDVVSPFVSNALPRNSVLGNIVVPFQLHDSSVAFAPPFYIGVRQQGAPAVASPALSSIPRHGFVSSGAKVSNAFHDSEYLEVLRIFTATVYSGARILRKLAVLHSHLTTSPVAVELTLQNEARHRLVIEGVRCYHVGEPVFVCSSSNKHGMFVSMS